MNSGCPTAQKEPEARGLDTSMLSQLYTVSDNSDIMRNVLSKEALEGASSTRMQPMYLWEPLYQCNICPATFLKKSLLENHEKNHVKEQLYKDGNEKTAVSSRRFSGKNKGNFSVDGPNMCEVCNKNFSQKSSLKLHMRIHAGEKPYVCKECKKGFQTKGNLLKHIRIHTGDKPYTCEICLRSFSQKESLKTHLRLHYNDRPFSCEICGKCFQTNGNLQIHKNVHTREKPFTCDICHKKFTQMGSLKTHKRVHSVDLRNHSIDLPNGCETNHNEASLIKQNFENLGVHMGKQSVNCETCKKGGKFLHKLETHMHCHYGNVSDSGQSFEPQPYQF